MLGTTNPADSAPGSIRGDFCIITGRNIIHGSDGEWRCRSDATVWAVCSSTRIESGALK